MNECDKILLDKVNPPWSCLTGSFINFEKSGKFRVARKGILGRNGVVNVPTWGFEGPAPECPWVKVGLPLPPVAKWVNYSKMDSIRKP